MKRLPLLLMLCISVLPFGARAIEITASSTLSLPMGGVDSYGLGGSLWTFTFSTSETQYSDQGGDPFFLINLVTLEISGASEAQYNTLFPNLVEPSGGF